MINICEIVKDYNLIYKKLSYGIEVCEEEQRNKTLEYIRNNKLSSNCITPILCGTTLSDNSYICSPLVITSIGPNNLMATLYDFNYCFYLNPFGSTLIQEYHLSFWFNVTYNNPSTIVISAIDFSLDTVIQPYSNYVQTSLGSNNYRVDVVIPADGTEGYFRLRVSDGSTNIDFAKQQTLSVSKTNCNF